MRTRPMGNSGRTILFMIMVISIILSCFCLDIVIAIDTITSSKSIRDPESIVSSNNAFRLGFFSPNGSDNIRYVGIWYNAIPEFTPVWIANRNTPLNDSSGVVQISKEGNLVLLNGQQQVVWSSNVVDIVSKEEGNNNNSIAQLTEEGNLVLRQLKDNTIQWESFKHICDTVLPGMSITIKERTVEKTLITAWRNSSDPSVGNFSGGVDAVGLPQLIIWYNGRRYYRSDRWNGQITITSKGFFDLSYVRLTDGTRAYSMNFPYNAKTSLHQRFVLNSEGELSYRYWDDQKESWITVFERPQTECDLYGKCGPFAVCNPKNSPICSCLMGYEPKNSEKWRIGNWTEGCVRSKLFECERKQNSSEDVGKQDQFIKMENMKLPDFGNWSIGSLDQVCLSNCLNNCSCLAYVYDDNSGCVLWSEDLIDLQKHNSNAGQTIYIRVAYTQQSDRKRGNHINKVIIVVTVLIGALTAIASAFFARRWMDKQRERKKKRAEILRMDETSVRSMNPVKLQEVPLFTLQRLTSVTNNFDISNRLGQGGFGPVYKGKLPDGQEIAVKRLSRASGQGLEEFMNEVVVISKLQHKNLVKLLGCCVEAEEKMLVYEYMPNKSLDAFLFDPTKQELLDWKTRFNIIEGICRGLIYLHRDSRLKIIHRDLKASNILLDLELNPKISDFGMARIIRNNEDQANTRRVVGTYGYMPPEYAMQGQFSEKSDVFSFGVLLLEIVSGRRNTSFHDSENVLTLLGVAWKLWNERKIVELIDPVIYDAHNEVDICRCIHVGLLCVQEFPRNRPAIFSVISMLTSEIADLPNPKKPAFTEIQHVFNGDSSQQTKSKSSINQVTITIVQGR